jgi:hypothetical protein
MVGAAGATEGAPSRESDGSGHMTGVSSVQKPIPDTLMSTTGHNRCLTWPTTVLPLVFAGGRETARAPVRTFVWSAPMNRDVAHMNIDHFRKLLATETDQAKCVVLRRLLAEEETKLKAANDFAERKSRG